MSHAVDAVAWWKYLLCEKEGFERGKLDESVNQGEDECHSQAICATLS